MNILEKLKNSKIKFAQIDPFGWCNAKCWFCPVKYEPLPVEGKTVMPVELLEKIFFDLAQERELDQIVSKDFRFFYTAHYNEILLYKHLEDLFKIARKYKFHTMILSNGTTLTPERSDLISQYPDVVSGVCLNVPAFEAETWSKRAGFGIDKFELLINNITYATTRLKYMTDYKGMSLQINGVDDNSFNYRISKGPNFDDLNIDLNPETGELAQQVKKAKELFPQLVVNKQSSLVNRSGLIDHVITNKPIMMVRSKSGTKQIIGCTNMGDRTTDWLHVNASGNAFLCCNDYNYDYKFGDFKTQSLRDFWVSDTHAQVIEKAYKEICTKCDSAKFEDS
jgi:radical SAM protein with 4Fe4S-binding SPASM domain